MSSLFGYCEHCGAPRTSAIVPTPDGKRSHAVGLVCSADASHGPDGAAGGELGTLGNEERCNRCGGENVIWSAPSPLWNLVMRGNDINGKALWGDLVCIRCFVVLAEGAGVRARWRVSANPEPEGLVKVTPSGRVWDDEKWLWVEPQRPPVPASTIRLHWFGDENDDECQECGWWAHLDSARRHHVEDALAADLAVANTYLGATP